MSEHELSRRFGNDDDAVIEALDKRDTEIERLKKALNSILELDGTRDLPDAWDIAAAAIAKATIGE